MTLILYSIHYGDYLIGMIHHFNWQTVILSVACSGSYSFITFHSVAFSFFLTFCSLSNQSRLFIAVLSGDCGCRCDWRAVQIPALWVQWEAESVSTAQLNIQRQLYPYWLQACCLHCGIQSHLNWYHRRSSWAFALKSFCLQYVYKSVLV